jgi:hypothetical protein
MLMSEVAMKQYQHICCEPHVHGQTLPTIIGHGGGAHMSA